MKKNKNLTSLDQFIEKEIGEKGTKKRTKFETGYEVFKLGVLLQAFPIYTTPGPSHNQSHSPSNNQCPIR